MRDHLPITIDTFGGLYDRGIDDAVPHDHFIEATNIQYSDKEVKSRYGTALNFTTITGIKRIKLYKRTGEATRLLILDSSGNIYDSSSTAAPILTVANMDDFRMAVFNNRAYITPIDDFIGVSGSYVYVYDGTNPARKIAGAAPTGTLTVTASVDSGVVETGYHLYAVSFETSTGFITKPGPLVYGILESDGTKKVDISGVPTGPAGTVARHILATKAIQVANYTGNQEGYEFFYVPDGTIADNSTTSITVNFYDADLFDSAEYLFDQSVELNACAGIGEYKGRMILWNQNYIYVSKVGEPESFDSLVGLIAVGLGDSSYIKNCTEYREVLYIDKQFHSYATQDNGGDPGTWVVLSLDKSVGSSAQGTIQILDKQGANADKFLLCSHRGLVIYDGIYETPELSYKIDAIWKRINKNYFDLVHGVHDPISKHIYVAVPLDAATSCSHILVGNHANGLDAANIRWSIWSSSQWNPTSILIDLANNTPYLRIAANAGIYNVSTSAISDQDNAISIAFRTGFVAPERGYFNHFHSIRARIRIAGYWSCTLYGVDDSVTYQLFNLSLFTGPAQNKDLTWLSNFQNEQVSVRFYASLLNSTISLSRLDIFSKVLWASRPL